MNQKRYNALAREYNKMSLDINEYEDMDPADKSDFVDYIKERANRLKDELAGEKSKNAIKNKQREINRIEKFLDQIEKNTEKENPVEDMHAEKSYEEFCKEGRNLPAYSEDINRSIYGFLKEQELLDHFVVYDKENAQIIDISANSLQIATVTEDNNKINIIPDADKIKVIKEAEKKAIEDAKKIFENEDLTKVYINHHVTGENTIYGVFGESSTAKRMPLKAYEFEAKSKFADNSKREKTETETKVLETTVANTSHNIYENQKDPEENFAEMFEKSLDTPLMDQAGENEIFHVDGLDFDIENFKGTLLMAIDTMEIDGWDPKSLELDFYDDGTGAALGKVTTNDGCKKEIIFGDIDKYNNFHVKSDEEIFSQIGVTDKPIDEKNLSVNKELEEEKKNNSKTTVKKSKWEQPKEIDAYKVVMSDKGEFFMTLDSEGRIFKGGKPEHMLYAKSDKGKTIMKSLNKIAKVSGVEKDKLVIVDGCSYVTTVDGRQVGILSNDGHVLATERDIKEQQILYDFAQEKEIHIQGLHIDENVIYSQSNTPLGYLNKTVEDLLGSSEKPEIKIDESNLIEERESYLADKVSENGIKNIEVDEEEIEI